MSAHAKHRVNQRYGGNDDLEVLTRKAIHYGVSPCQVAQGSDLRLFLESKEYATGKKIKVLQGYVFVFSKSNRLITMYRIPEALREEAKALESIEAFNRENWKKWKNSMNSSQAKPKNV